MEYDGKKVKRVDTIVISTQHDPEATQEQIRKDMIENVILPIVPAELLDENTKTSSVIYSFTTRDCTQISTLYSHNILYYESDEYFILGGLCISKDYIFSTTIANIGTSNTSYARGHSFIYDIKREYNILPLNISNIGISSTGSIYAYPVISTDDYIYNNILNICTPLDIYPGIYLMNGKKYFMTSEISYRVKNTANTKYCWAILLDKMK